jgi:hypothetical protein
MNIKKRLNGGYTYHLVPEGADKALCGAYPKSVRTVGRKMRIRACWRTLIDQSNNEVTVCRHCKDVSA